MSDAYDSGMRGREKPKRGEIEEVSIKPAKNGYVVRCVYGFGSGAPIPIDESRKPSVFASLDEALEHARQELSRKGGEESDRT